MQTHRQTEKTIWQWNQSNVPHLNTKVTNIYIFFPAQVMIQRVQHISTFINAYFMSCGNPWLDWFRQYVPAKSKSLHININVTVKTVQISTSSNTVNGRCPSNRIRRLMVFAFCMNVPEYRRGSCQMQSSFLCRRQLFYARRNINPCELTKWSFKKCLLRQKCSLTQYIFIQ